jgi:hypothetical protein
VIQKTLDFGRAFFFLLSFLVARAETGQGALPVNL